MVEFNSCRLQSYVNLVLGLVNKQGFCLFRWELVAGLLLLLRRKQLRQQQRFLHRHHHHHHLQLLLLPLLLPPLPLFPPRHPRPQPAPRLRWPLDPLLLPHRPAPLREPLLWSVCLLRIPPKRLPGPGLSTGEMVVTIL